MTKWSIWRRNKNLTNQLFIDDITKHIIENGFIVNF